MLYIIKGGILFEIAADRQGLSVFIAAGTNDPICSPMESAELQSLLEKANANVVIHWENRGHQLTMQEVEAAENWYLKQI